MSQFKILTFLRKNKIDNYFINCDYNLMLKQKLLILFSIISFGFTSPKYLKSVELSILCIKETTVNDKKDIKDIIVSLNSKNKSVEIGGLRFIADQFIITDSNIRWSADKVDNLYDESPGYAAGTLGRFSGNLSLVFRKENNLKDNNMNLSCKRYKIKDRKF